MPEWYEDDALWAVLYPFTFSDERQAAGEDQVEKILKLVRTRPATALDLGCRVGRHAVALAPRGLRVTAVDRTGFLLDKARARAAEAHVEVELVQADMRPFVRLGPSTWPSASSRRSGTSTTRRSGVLENLHRSL